MSISMVAGLALAGDIKEPGNGVTIVSIRNDAAASESQIAGFGPVVR
jgi:hypothetical protein